MLPSWIQRDDGFWGFDKDAEIGVLENTRSGRVSLSPQERRKCKLSAPNKNRPTF